MSSGINKVIGQTIASSDTPLNVSDKIVIDGTTSSVILTEEVVPQGAPSNRLMVVINVLKNDAWIKLQEASVDNDLKGILIQKNGHFAMVSPTMYYGEISAISDKNESDIYVTVV